MVIIRTVGSSYVPFPCGQRYENKPGIGVLALLGREVIASAPIAARLLSRSNVVEQKKPGGNPPGFPVHALCLYSASLCAYCMVSAWSMRLCMASGPCDRMKPSMSILSPTSGQRITLTAEATPRSRSPSRRVAACPARSLS